MKDLDSEVLVLYYHRINDIKEDPFALCVSTERFEAQMSYLKDNYPILRFEDEWKTKGIVITFDDGYADNLYHALPILIKYQIPATVFISSGQIIRGGINWWDELYELIVVQNHTQIIEIKDESYGCKWKTHNRELKLNCFLAIHKLFNHYVDSKKREILMEQIRKQVTIRNFSCDYALLTEEDIKKLSESALITIGGHTVSHSSLGRLSVKQQEEEIRDNILYLENIVGKRIKVFSYPFGTVGVDINDNTVELCRKYGIEKAATTEQKKYSNQCKLMIPRCEVKNWDKTDFAQKVDDFWRRK